MDDHLLAFRFRPVLLYDSRNTSFPCSIENLLQHCALVDSTSSQILVPIGKVDFCQLIRHNGQSDLEIVSSVPVNVPLDRVIRMSMMYHMYRDQDFIYCTYIFLYAMNPGYACCCRPYVWDHHEGDIEHITVKIIPGNCPKIHSVYFAAHGGTQGQWKRINQCKFQDQRQERVNVYVSPWSHASYSCSGLFPRVFCFANDQCDAQGPIWDPADVTEITQDTIWNKFQGRIGYHNGPRTPLHQAWWYVENKQSINSWKRFFACF